MKEINLVKRSWTKEDGQEFQKYLLSLGRGEAKGKWEKNIVRTNLPCIAVLSSDIKRISNEISRGNFLSFLDLGLNETLSNSLLSAHLISKIKDFETFKKCLTKFVENADNWASIDSLEFKVKGKEKEFLTLSKTYISSQKPFVRRAGVRILFKFIESKNIDNVFDIIVPLQAEQDYYVNMAVAWLVCECFIKQRQKTMEFLGKDKLNKFALNKAISKCHDSFRVTKEDKEMLKTLRK